MYDKESPRGRLMGRDTTYKKNSRVDSGELCGVPTWTGEKVLSDSWKSRRHDL